MPSQPRRRASEAQERPDPSLALDGNIIDVDALSEGDGETARFARKLRDQINQHVESQISARGKREVQEIYDEGVHPRTYTQRA